jgi:thiosulfate dehydrogenase
MMRATKNVRRLVTVGVVLSAGAVASTVLARAPFTEEELAQQKDALYEMVQQGYDMWHGTMPSMTTNGLACGNCHPDSAASNPQTFPKYMTMYGKVIPWQEMVNWCIENPQLGERIDPTSDEMTALKAYAMYLHRGKPIEPGLASRQTSAVVVEYGTGFKREPTGLGADTKEYSPN